MVKPVRSDAWQPSGPPAGQEGSHHQEGRVCKNPGRGAAGRISGLPVPLIDTCCIDKTSSAELSEAINSMFMHCRVLLSWRSLALRTGNYSTFNYLRTYLTYTSLTPSHFGSGHYLINYHFGEC